MKTFNVGVEVRERGEVRMMPGCLACAVGWTVMPLTKAFSVM